VSASETSDETGIIAAGLGNDGRGYVLADRSLRTSPDAWARRAVSAYHEFKADRIVAEANNGGEMVRLTIRTVDPNVPVTLVHASRGKYVRAEPVAALYEQGRVSHVEPFPDLEDQLCSYTPESGDSPDRLDALVWALTDLMLTGYHGSTEQSWIA
jgi:predicted phage terminase large subunit-like protein